MPRQLYVCKVRKDQLPSIAFQKGRWRKNVREIRSDREKPRCCANSFLQGIHFQWFGWIAKLRCLRQQFWSHGETLLPGVSQTVVGYNGYLGEVRRIARWSGLLLQVVVCETESGQRELLSFVMPNQVLPDKVDLKSYLVPLDTIERASGLLFFDRIPKKTFSKINGKSTSFWGWELWVVVKFFVYATLTGTLRKDVFCIWKLSLQEE